MGERKKENEDNKQKETEATMANLTKPLSKGKL